MEHQEFDFIIVGSGAASVPAALAARQRGKTALIIEKQDLIGGSSALSGGVIWIPNTDQVNAARGDDSVAKARAYIDAVVGDPGPSTSSARKDAFIRNGSEMVRFLEGKGMKFLHASWPDYYDTLPGGLATGRSLSAPLFDVKRLGAWSTKLARHPITSAMPMLAHHVVYLHVMKRSWRGKRIMARMLLQVIQDRLLRRTTRGAGNAMSGRLFEIALREGVPIWAGTPVGGLISANGVVTGVRVERDGQPLEIRARCGVLLNTGGFSHNLPMREAWLPAASSVAWSSANAGDTGEMMTAAMDLGAAVDLMDEAVWQASSFLADGSLFCFHSPNDIGKPHCIVVGTDGRRFGNESCSYVEFGQRMYAAGAVPAYAVFDTCHRQNYSWGMMPPGKPAQKYLDSGYLIQADSVAELAQRCGIDAEALAQTIARFNGFARAGVDQDFQRGVGAYNRYFGDEHEKPNASLGTIEQGPFYAVKLQPGDLGTTGGLVTDEFARVLRGDGTVIAGLYAAGTSTASVFGRKYPGAGGTVGPSMTFGYIAGKHAAESGPPGVPSPRELIEQPGA